MEKRVFLAFFLSFGILALYQTYIVPPPPQADPNAAVTSPAIPDAVPPAAAPVENQPAAQAAPATTAGAPEMDATPVREIVVDTEHVRVVFTTEGASVKSWRLKKYLDEQGQPLEIVPASLPETAVRPFTLATDQADVSARLRTARFRSSAEDIVSLGNAPGTVSFEYSDPSTGLVAQKSFHFQPTEQQWYSVTVDASVAIGGVSRPVTLRMGPSLGRGFGSGSAMLPSYPPAPVFQQNNDVERLSASDLAEQSFYEGTLRFAGVGDHYFLSAAVPVNKSIRVDYAALTLPVPEPLATETGVSQRTFIDYSITSNGAVSLPFFIGPKDFDILRTVDSQLVRAIDFGIFAWLVVPLLQSLKWLYGYLGNYGWSIIALTVLLNVLMFPLRHRSMVSMRKMQEVQPEVKAIQKRYEKYKMTDPERQKMNTEMMALYKQKGVNPASGCVPMLLTFPVLFAFYAMLSVAIELRGAPWIGWITDLSVMDPLYITPVLMGATMFLQQRMTPSTADPVQQKVFMFMPLMFSVMFLWAPAGLVLYWLMSNIMTIGQQLLTNRIIGAPPRTTGGTSAERRAKSVGSGSTLKG
ncbi:MAG: membrane protein insertase YidC [Vicinamibacterales bacterium]